MMLTLASNMSEAATVIPLITGNMIVAALIIVAAEKVLDRKGRR
jgi:hypothetical protein